MTLAYVVENLDDVDAAFHAEYIQRDGKFYLDVTGVKSAEEFTTVHNALAKERNEHKTTKTALKAYGGVSAEEVTANMARLQELELTGGKVDDATVSKLVETRLQQKVAPLERQVGELTEVNKNLVSERDSLQGQITRTTMVEGIRAIAKKVGLRDTAIEDAVMLGSMHLEVTENGVVTKSDISGVTPGLSPETWLVDMRTKRPHWFEESFGGGSGGGGKGGSFMNNPWLKAHWNLTEQANMYRSDRNKAEQMMRSAGVALGATQPVK